MNVKQIGLVALAAGTIAALTAANGPRYTLATRQLSPAADWVAHHMGNPQPPAGTPQSRYAYAQACAVDIGTIPDGYDCTKGDLIPITKNGVPQSTPVADNSCDKPVKLGLSNEGQCVPYTRLVDLSPANNKDVTIMAICRRYHGRPAANTQFDDLAIVAHNRKNGSTCFFQSPVDQPTPLEGKSVPSPMSNSAAASKYWLEPLGAPNNVSYTAPGGITCTSCHDSDPFILSPWIQQVAKLNEWDSTGKYLVDLHGTFSGVAGRPWVTKGISAPQPFTQFTKCVACHRIGGSTLHVIANGPGGLHASNGFPDLHGFMPPGNADSAMWWPYVYNEAVFELDNCVNPVSGTPAAGCNAVRAGTIH